MRTFALFLAVMATVTMATATCGDTPKYTSWGSPLQLVSIKQSPGKWNVPDLYQCPASMRPNAQTDFDNEILLYVFNQQKNNNKLPRAYNCQITPGSLSTSDTSSCVTNCGGSSQNQGFNPGNNNCNNNQGWNPDGGNNQGFNPNGNQSGFNQWPKTALVNGVVSYSCGSSQGWGPSKQFNIAYQTKVIYTLTPDCQNDCQNGQGFNNGNTVC